MHRHHNKVAVRTQENLSGTHSDRTACCSRFLRIRNKVYLLRASLWAQRETGWDWQGPHRETGAFPGYVPDCLTPWIHRKEAGVSWQEAGCLWSSTGQCSPACLWQGEGSWRHRDVGSPWGSQCHNGVTAWGDYPSLAPCSLTPLWHLASCPRQFFWSLPHSASAESWSQWEDAVMRLPSRNLPSSNHVLDFPRGTSGKELTS